MMNGRIGVLLLLALGSWALLGPPVCAAPGQRVEASEGEGDLEARLGRLEEDLRRLQAQLDRLLQRTGTDPSRIQELEARVKELTRQLEILTRELERRKLGPAYGSVGASRHGLGPAASKVYDVERGVSIGGYGELLYQNFEPRRDDGAASQRQDELDFLRGVFYFGYKFNDRILFNSEIEYEHASTGEDGEVAVEFAYLDFLVCDAFNVRAGLLLVPVGFLNELHEPPVFLGARRPDVERAVIPTTWRENGAGVFGDVGPVSYRAYLLNGLDASGFSAATGIRGGRQKGSRAAATDVALAGRVDWMVMPGLLVGASAYVGDSGQGVQTPAGETIDGRVLLYDVHGEWKWRGVQVRGLWTRVEIDDAGAINQLPGVMPSGPVGERLAGWYGQVGYDVFSRGKTEQALIPYVRVERYDTHERVPPGFQRDPSRDVGLLTVGLAYQPIPQVSLKVDFQNFDDRQGTGTDQVNVALGYLF